MILHKNETMFIMGDMETVFEAAGGSDGLLRLADAWHRRVMADEVVGHAFSHGFHPQHVERLAAYWAEALGGPSTYSDSYGDETTVVKMHSGNGEHDEMDRRAIACFDEALADIGLAGDPALRHSAARLLRLGDHHNDVPLSPIRRRCAERPQHPTLVMGRTPGVTLRLPYGAPYSCRYTLALRKMACTYSRVSVNGMDSTNSCGSRYFPCPSQSSTRFDPAL